MLAVATVVTVVHLAVAPVPAVMKRIAVCETGSNPRHATRDYISMYGIYRPAWNEYRPRWVKPVASRRVAGERLPSVSEQHAVAMAIARKAGLSAWGCWRHSERVRHGAR